MGAHKHTIHEIYSPHSQTKTGSPRLADIQEFYEDTLVNERKSVSQKAYETSRIADRWEANPPLLSAAHDANNARPFASVAQGTQPDRPLYKAAVRDPLLFLSETDHGGRGVMGD